jgi:hypothetical protein
VKAVGHLQLLLALMKAGDWEPALLMLDWLQVWVQSVIFVLFQKLEMQTDTC